MAYEKMYQNGGETAHKKSTMILCCLLPAYRTGRQGSWVHIEKSTQHGADFFRLLLLVFFRFFRFLFPSIISFCHVRDKIIIMKLL